MRGQRLSALDASFLHLEDAGSAHMHLGACLVFAGSAPGADELREHLAGRLHLVPRYRQRLAFVPKVLTSPARPVWVDDPHFNIGYHVRHTALPAPGGEGELAHLCGRLFSQRLDRSKPLWEMWLAEGLADGGFAVVVKTHHCLVDGVSGVDLTGVLFDTQPEPVPPPPPVRPWVPRPAPSGVELLADALLERATVPAEALRGARAALRAPRRLAERLRHDVLAVGALVSGGADAPRSALNVEIGPHRRFTWAEIGLDEAKAVKNALGGTVNDVVLTTVALALGAFLRGRGERTDGLELRAMVPVSVRAEGERGGLGNRVASMWAPLPVGERDPARAYAQVRDAMAGLKASGQAVGAEVLTRLAGFAPPAIMAQAARLQTRQRFFNLVVTNVPGPQFPLYLLGRRLRAFRPQVPLARRQALGIAIMSYDGRMDFGLLADYDALPDVDDLAGGIGTALAALRTVARSRAGARA